MFEDSPASDFPTDSETDKPDSALGADGEPEPIDVTPSLPLDYSAVFKEGEPSVDVVADNPLVEGAVFPSVSDDAVSHPVELPRSQRRRLLQERWAAIFAGEVVEHG